MTTPHFDPSDASVASEQEMLGEEPMLPQEEKKKEPNVRFMQIAVSSAVFAMTPCLFLSDKLLPLLSRPTGSAQWQYLALLSVMAVGILAACHELAKVLFNDYVVQRREASKLLASLTLPEGLCLATLTAFAEEFLLRGVVPPLFGLSAIGLLFALLQITSKGRLTVFLLLGLTLSLTLSIITYFSQSLYPGLGAHLAVNLGLLFYLRSTSSIRA